MQAQGEVLVDPDIPDLLVFPPHTDLHNNSLYTAGKVILQDKVGVALS